MIVLPKRGNHNTIFMKGKGLGSSKDKQVTPDEENQYIDPDEYLEENLFMIENINTKIDNLYERITKLTNELRSDRNADQRFKLEIRKYKEIIKRKTKKRERLEKLNKEINEGRMIPVDKYREPTSDVDSDEEYMED
tara:strand:- start:252 stop:662 length:411 start_codon:yes stop_codon:yes gene_type:complete